MKEFENADAMFMETGLDLDDFILVESDPVKHDVTHYFGYIPQEYYFREVSYEVSYNNGLQCIYVDMDSKFQKKERTVVETYYAKV